MERVEGAEAKDVAMASAFGAQAATPKLVGFVVAPLVVSARLRLMVSAVAAGGTAIRAALPAVVPEPFSCTKRPLTSDAGSRAALYVSV